MKAIFQLCKIAFACVLIFYLFPSCHVASIIIKNGDTATQKLTLVDSAGNPADTFYVDAGKRIRWVISKGSNVSSITRILEKPGSPIVLKKPPHKKWLSKKWKARIKRGEALSADHEDYYIDWRDKNGNQYRYDPRIQINSMSP